jgi:ribonuclease HII
VCPWYGDLSPALPRDPARSACTGAALKLRATMDAVGVACAALRIELLTEDEFNRRMAVVHNKHTLVVEAVLRLMHWAATSAAQAGDTDMHVYVDRLGGRTDYRELLMLAFPERSLHVLEVCDACSRYRLATATSDWYVEFRVAGDSRHLPIALASMLAKYVRELLMERFNAYWCGLAPALRPTAGYYGDARRFMADIEPLLLQTGLPASGFVRTC